MFFLMFRGSQKRSGLQVVASYSPPCEYVVTARSKNRFKQASEITLRLLPMTTRNQPKLLTFSSPPKASQRFTVAVTCRRSPASLLLDDRATSSVKTEKKRGKRNVLDGDSRPVADDCNPLLTPPCPPSELHDPRLHRRPTFSLALAEWPWSKVIFAI